MKGVQLDIAGSSAAAADSRDKSDGVRVNARPQEAPNIATDNRAYSTTGAEDMRHSIQSKKTVFINIRFRIW
jgi:hypothetical protein